MNINYEKCDFDLKIISLVIYLKDDFLEMILEVLAEDFEHLKTHSSRFYFSFELNAFG